MIKETNFYVHAKFMNEAKDKISNFQGKTTINSPTGNFFYDPWTIKEEYVGTVWETILKTLDVIQGEARIIVLEPGECYMAHADIDDRYHLNLSGKHSFLIDIVKNKMHSTVCDGLWYEMDAGKIHSAVNFGETPRAQLVVRKLLKRAKIVNPVSVTIMPVVKSFDYRYQFDSHVSPLLNHFNKKKSIDGFNFTEEKVNFITDFECIHELQKLDKNLFSVQWMSNE